MTIFKSVFSISGSILAIAILGACSSGLEKEVGTPDTHTQSEKVVSLDESSVSIARIESVVALLADEKSVVSDNTVLEMKKLLEDNKCHIDYEKPDYSVANTKGYLEISGTGCPLQANYVLKFVTEADSVIFSLSADFLIEDSAIKAKNDIYKMTLTGTGRIDINGKRKIYRMKIGGFMTSASKGKIQFESKRNEAQNALDPHYLSQGSTSYTFYFPPKTVIVDKKETLIPGYSVEIKKMLDISQNKDQSKFYINNSEIDRLTYNSYVDKLGMIGFEN